MPKIVNIFYYCVCNYTRHEDVSAQGHLRISVVLVVFGPSVNHFPLHVGSYLKNLFKAIDLKFDRMETFLYDENV